VEGAKWRDPQQIKQYMAAYVQRNRDKHNERSRAWNAANPHKKATIRQKRRARHVGGTLTAEQWAWLVKRCGGCLCCGRSDVKLTPDHVIPLSRGGPNDLWNIQPLCASCNSRKNTATTDYRSQELLIEIQEKEEEMTVRSRGTTRCDFCPRRATWMLPHTGEIYCSGCRAKALEVVKKMEPIKAESLIKQLTEALIWCSAASDFQEGGVAREGWLKTAPLIDQASAYLARKTERP
jgi:5-methylcytosine-specific restriction endonuclease McrA